MGAMPLFDASCDMTTDGGGWTGISPSVARNVLNGTLVAADDAATVAYDSDRPCTRDDSGDQYEALAYAEGTAEMDPSHFKQSDWSFGYGYDPPVGDISFGTPADAGPVTSFAQHLVERVECASCSVPWPAGPQRSAVGAASTSFRIGWGEGGSQYEGWCPWWSGRVLLR